MADNQDMPQELRIFLNLAKNRDRGYRTFGAPLVAELFGFSYAPTSEPYRVVVGGYEVSVDQTLGVCGFLAEKRQNRPMTLENVNAAVKVLHTLVTCTFPETGYSVYEAFAAFTLFKKKWYESQHAGISITEAYAGKVVEAFVLNGASVDGLCLPR